MRPDPRIQGTYIPDAEGFVRCSTGHAEFTTTGFCAECRRGRGFINRRQRSCGNPDPAPSIGTIPEFPGALPVFASCLGAVDHYGRHYSKGEYTPHA